MGTWTKEEAAASLRQLEELGAEAKRLSAVPMTEKEGRQVRSSLATCSLPVSSAELLEWLQSRIASCEEDERAARAFHEYNQAQDQRTMADAYSRVVLFVQRRADAARATERQPEENEREHGTRPNEHRQNQSRGRGRPGVVAEI